MRNILLVIKEPYLDKIPNLMTLIRFFDRKGDSVTIVSIVDQSYLIPGFSDSSRVSLHKVRPKKKKLSLPSSVRLLVHVSAFLFSERRKGRAFECIIGTGFHGNLIALLMSRVFGQVFVNHCLEYPTFKDSGEEPYTVKEAFYNNVIMKHSDFIVTHDDVHVDIISKKLEIDKGTFLVLPNSTTGPVVRLKSGEMRRNNHIEDWKTIVLHSGGLGVWFGSRELAQSTAGWGDDNVLVFHTSHVAAGNEYYENMRKVEYDGKVFFSTVPVPSEQLDDYVSGADIGVAWYEKAVLGYRCEYMGMAAGKIGNYLKCGLPVITNNFDSLSAYIDGYGCGICVDHIDEIGGAVDKIKCDYERYRENAFRCYEELWAPERFLKAIYSRIFREA
ncbi:MAG: glycosyltransferase family 4 protein [Chlorobiaceae bacterium]|nr:glycosyltransferase family 4 protein [Chlorobiaceae bacterium]